MPLAKETTKIVRRELEKICKEFSNKVIPLNFHRTKKMFWTRQHPLTIDFIHFHRSGSTYGSPLNYSVDIRVHFGIRAINDSFEAAALNGPYSDPGRIRSGRYHFRFNAKSGSNYDRCLEDLVRFVVEQGEPWFNKFQAVENLLRQTDSPLNADTKRLLELAHKGYETEENVQLSLKLFGINKKSKK